MSRGSSIVDEGVSAEPGHEKMLKPCTGKMATGETTSCLDESSSYGGQPEAVDGEDQRRVPGRSWRLNRKDTE